MQTRTIGNDTVGRVEVGAVGLGLMTFDQTGHQPREQLLDTVRAALDAGVTLFDTADAYGPGDEKGAGRPGRERAADRLAARRARASATGCCWPPRAVTSAPRAAAGTSTARPDHLRRAVDASLQRLGVEQIALWQHHRPDPKVDYAETHRRRSARSLSRARSRMIGLSNADPDQIRRGARGSWADSLVSVQNQFSPKFRSSRPEIEVCEELGLAFLPVEPARRAVGRQGARRATTPPSARSPRPAA